MSKVSPSIQGFSISTLADAWGCSARHIDNLITARKLKAYRIGRRGKRVTEASALEYIATQEFDSAMLLDRNGENQ